MADKEQQIMMKQVLRYSSIGLELGAVYGLLIYMGQRLDAHYGCTPWCTIGCFAFATICAILLFVGIIRDYRQEDKPEDNGK